MRINNFFIKGPPKSPPFEKNLHFDLLDHQVDTLSLILSPKFRVRAQELSLLKGLMSEAFHIFEARNDTFLIKRPPKSPPFEKILHFDLLDHQVDTLSFILSPKF